MCITSLHKRMFPGRYNSEKDTSIESKISSQMAQVLFFSSLTLTLFFQGQTYGILFDLVRNRANNAISSHQIRSSMFAIE